MAHNLFGNRFAERQGEGRQRAWHHLGQTFTERLSAREALELAGMTYRIRKFPVVIDMTPRDKAGEVLVTPKGEPATTRHLPVPDQYAIVREAVAEDPENRVLGYVGKGYQIMQNADVADLIDRFRDRWSVETVGALGKGETLFFSMKTGAFEVAGDAIEEYVVVSDTRDGSGGQVWMSTPIRVVCENTLSWGMDAATSKVSLSHSAALVAEAGEMAAIYSQLHEIQKKGREALAHLVDIPVIPAVAETLIEAVYPIPEQPAKVKLALAVDGAVEAPALMAGKKAWEQAKARVFEWRKDVHDLYLRFNDEFTASAQTAYALFNAVSEFEDHHRSSRNERTRAESAIFGDRAQTKSRAFDLLSALG